MYCNKHVQAQTQRNNDLHHHQSLRHMRACIDTAAPRTLAVRPKRPVKQLLQHNEIARSNGLLLEKMLEIERKPSQYAPLPRGGLSSRGQKLGQQRGRKVTKTLGMSRLIWNSS